MMKRARAKALTVGVGVVLLAVAGLAQTSTCRPVLQAVTRMAHGGCPFGYDKPMSPAERERANLSFAAQHRGERRAASRPALGFELDHTTRSEVLTLMTQHGVTCTAAKGFSDLTCNGVPSSALQGVSNSAPSRNLWFTFGEKQRLLSVVAISRDVAPRPISEAFVATQALLDHQAGAAAAASGNPNADALAAGLLNQASAEFRFTDYYALARATNFGKSYVLTEEYRSLPD